MDDPVVLLAGRSELHKLFSSRLLQSIDKAMAPNAANRFQSCGEWKTWAWAASSPAPVIPAAAPASTPEPPAVDDLATVVRRTRPTDSSPQPSLPAVESLPASTQAAKSKPTPADAANPSVSKSKTKGAVPATPSPPAKGKSNTKGAAILSCSLVVVGLTLAGFFVLSPSKPPAGWDPSQATQKQLDVYAEDGDVDAQVEQAMRILADGEKSGYANINATELSRAFELLKAAALKDHRRAMLPLGQCYLDGIGVEKAPGEAAPWLQKAAESGDARPMLLLGDCYRVGLGVPKDSQRAMEWYGRAAKGDQINLTAKMRSLALPGFAISDATLEEAVEALVRRSRELDVNETDPVRKGVPIIIDDSSGQHSGKVTVYPNDFQMDDALRYIADLYDLKTEVKPHAVLLKPLVR
jgi:hypothetical protein